METANNQELLNKYAGISSRIRRIFAYHYDQIQREIQAEVANINTEDANHIIDQTTLFMEEFMGWPDPDNQEIFNDQITNGLWITYNGNPTL